MKTKPKTILDRFSLDLTRKQVDYIYKHYTPTMRGESYVCAFDFKPCFKELQVQIISRAFGDKLVKIISKERQKTCNRP